MVINEANIVALFQTLSTRFQAGVQRTIGEDISFLTTEFPSTSEANFYGWMDLIPGFREWVGERIFNSVTGNNFMVPNRLFESSTAIPATKIEDDTYGIFGPIVEMKGAAWPILLREWIIANFTENPLTYTGAALAGTHKLGTRTLVNKTTNPFSKASFEAALIEAAEWKFSNGELIKPRFTHLIHGPAIRSTVHDVILSPTIATVVKNVAGTENVGGVSVPNPNYNKVKPVELEELAGAAKNYWWLIQAGGPIAPVALQIRERPVPMADTDAHRIKRNNKMEFIATARGNAKPTFPWLVYGGLPPEN